jgi:hypothetical protein
MATDIIILSRTTGHISIMDLCLVTISLMAKATASITTGITHSQRLFSRNRRTIHIFLLRQLGWAAWADSKRRDYLKLALLVS